ncbi:MAG: hypothetical protein J0I32_04615 [Sphingobacteriales bacterium]|nr:hypothetical protein [Sphingobacteriales bacterium]
MKTKTKNILIEIISALIIFLFAYTGLSKLIDHDSFENVLARSPVTKYISGTVSWILPLAEVVVAILILIPRVRIKGLLFSLILMCAFTAYIAGMLLFVSDLPCACGGIISRIGWLPHLIFNIFITLLNFMAWRLEKHDKLFIAINRNSRIPV